MKVIKQASILTIANVINKIIAVIFSAILARSFSIEDYGLFRYLLSLAGIYSVFLVGIPIALTKYISQHKNTLEEKNKYFSNGIILSIIIFIITALAVILTSSYELVLLVLIFGIVFEAFYHGLIRGIYDFIKLSTYRPLISIGKVLGVVLMVTLFKEQNLLYVVLIVALTPIVITAILEIIKKEKFKFTIKNISKKYLRDIIMFTLPVILASIGYDVMFNIDSILIKKFLGNSEVAVYSVARTFISAFTFVPMAITTIIMPKISHATHNSTHKKSDIKKKIKKTILAVFGLSVFIYIGFLTLGTFFIKLIFTEKYLVSYQALLILGIGQIFYVAFMILWSYWEGINKPFIPSIILLFSCVINVVGNYFLIPVYGINGAAVSTAGTSIIIFGLGWMRFKK